MVAKNKTWFVYVIGLLMLGAAAGRGLPQAFVLNSSYRWTIVWLLFGYSTLLASERLIVPRFPLYRSLYLILQGSIVAALLMIPLDPPAQPQSNDFFALLFIPLCAQALIYFPRPTSYYWVGILMITSVVSLRVQYGFNEWVQYSISYILGYVMVSFLAIYYLDAVEARNELAVAHDQLREYAAQAESLAVAEERNRLARDLHDSVTQSLYSLTLFAEAAHVELLNGEIDTTQSHLSELRQTAHQALQEMRLMVFELRPPELDEKGLALALQERLEAVETRAGVKTALEVNFTERLPPELELGMYSIAREAMNNILKHAQASQVVIRLHKESGKILMEVKDNGIGSPGSFGVGNGGLGIKGMQERAGQMDGHLRFSEMPEGGTSLTLEVPYGG